LGFLGIEIKDWIQLGIMVVLFVTLIVTLFFSYRQTNTHNRLFKAQIFSDIMTMYWKTYEPVSEDEMNEFKLYPEAYMPKALYERKYKRDKTARHNYLYLSKVYKYLIFAFALKKYKLSAPLTNQITETWAKELVKDKVFLDVHENCKDYYPLFAEYVESLKGKSKP